MKSSLKQGFILFVLFLLICVKLRAQADSLRRKLQTADDTTRVSLMNHLSQYYLEDFNYGSSAAFYMDSSIWYARKALALSESLGYQKGIGRSLFAWGKALSVDENHKSSLQYLIRALPIMKKADSRKAVANCYEFLAEDYHAMGVFMPAILYFDSSETIYLTLKDSAQVAYDLMMKGHCYCDLGNYKEAFTYGQEGYELCLKLNDSSLRLSSVSYLCSLFLEADLPQTAIDYFRRVFPEYPKMEIGDVNSSSRWILQMAGDAFLKLNQIDSASAVAQKLSVDTASVVEMLFRGRLNEAKGNYDQAIKYFQIGYQFSIRHNHPKAVTYHANEMARVYLAQKKYKLALRYAQIALTSAETIHAMKDITAANGTLSSIYAGMNDFKKAFFYGNQFKILSNIMLPDEFRRVLALKDVQSELQRQKQAVQILSRENLVKESNLRQEKTIRNMSFSALLALLVIGALLILNVRLRRKKAGVQQLMEDTSIQLENKKKEQKMVELEREKLDLEMQALRAQMNPHFIFNCLSSINRFILKNETEAASDYLTKFSRLIRMVLVNSKNTFIPLEDELDMLRLYLDMERLRFRDSFDYQISQTNSIDLRSLFIPPLLLQPFAENAIWHGLMHKEGPGKLTVELSLEKDILHCVITDNGIGREESARMKSKSVGNQKSLGLQITADRLAILNRDMEEPIFFNIEDLHDEEGSSSGTRVTIQIHCRDLSFGFTD